MSRITFIKDHRVAQGDGKGPYYKTGETYDLEESYAEKYKRLGLAKDAEPPARGKGKAKADQDAAAPALALSNEAPAGKDTAETEGEIKRNFGA